MHTHLQHVSDPQSRIKAMAYHFVFISSNQLGREEHYHILKNFANRFIQMSELNEDESDAYFPSDRLKLSLA